MDKIVQMKRLVLYTLIILSFGCKNKPENLIVLKGSYIFFEDAAVLQTPNEIYGVYLNDKALELNKLARSFKANPSDAIIAELKGIISTEDHDTILWEKKFEIVEIISTSSKKETENTLILGEK